MKKLSKQRQNITLFAKIGGLFKDQVNSKCFTMFLVIAIQNIEKSFFKQILRPN